MEPMNDVESSNSGVSALARHHFENDCSSEDGNSKGAFSLTCNKPLAIEDTSCESRREGESSADGCVLGEAMDDNGASEDQWQAEFSAFEGADSRGNHVSVPPPGTSPSHNMDDVRGKQDGTEAMSRGGEVTVITEDSTSSDANTAKGTIEEDFGEFGDFGEFSEASHARTAAEATAVIEAKEDGGVAADKCAVSSDSSESVQVSGQSQSVESRLRVVLERCFGEASAVGEQDLLEMETAERQPSVFDSEFAAPQRAVWRSALVVESSPATNFVWQQSRLNLLLLRSLKVDTRNLLISSRNIRVVPAFAKGLGAALQPSGSGEGAERSNWNSNNSSSSFVQVEMKRSETCDNNDSLVTHVFSVSETSKAKANVDQSGARPFAFDEFLQPSVAPTPKVQSNVKVTTNEAEIIAKIRSMKTGCETGCKSNDSDTKEARKAANDAEIVSR